MTPPPATGSPAEMSASDEARAWAETVQAVAEDRDLVYEPVGGINPVGGPVALCPGRDQPDHRAARRGLLGRLLRRRRAGGGRAVLEGRASRRGAGQVAGARPGQGDAALQRRVDRAPARRAGDPTRLAPQGRVREPGLQQALPGDRAERVRPGRAARGLQPRVPGLGDDDRRRDRLRRLRAAALVPVAAPRPQPRPARGRARQRRRAVQAGAQGGGGVGGPHLPGGPLARRAGAVPE